MYIDDYTIAYNIYDIVIHDVICTYVMYNYIWYIIYTVCRDTIWHTDLADPLSSSKTMMCCILRQWNMKIWEIPKRCQWRKKKHWWIFHTNVCLPELSFSTPNVVVDFRRARVASPYFSWGFNQGPLRLTPPMIDVEDSPLVGVGIGGVLKCVGNISHRQITAKMFWLCSYSVANLLC